MSRRSIEHGPGVLAPDDPVQADVRGRDAFEHAGYTITPAAKFSVQARILGTERYRVGRAADLSPVDFALGWGRMSDSAVIEQLSISQSNRFYWYRWSDEPPIPSEEIVSHSANMHLIPATPAVASRLLDARVGQRVKLDGLLVRVTARDGWHWNSSMTRDDSGDGACELVWVESVSLN
ncbi:MAG: hypothetical protein AB7Q97_12750 [Gammaproteobacteria bacterium]